MRQILLGSLVALVAASCAYEKQDEVSSGSGRLATEQVFTGSVYSDETVKYENKSSIVRDAQDALAVEIAKRPGYEGFTFVEPTYVNDPKYSTEFDLTGTAKLALVNNPVPDPGADNRNGGYFPSDGMFCDYLPNTWENAMQSDPNFVKWHTAGARLIWENYYVRNPTRGDLVKFSKTFKVEGKEMRKLEGTENAAVLFLAVDNAAIAFLNGNYIGKTATVFNGYQDSNNDGVVDDAELQAVFGDLTGYTDHYPSKGFFDYLNWATSGKTLNVPASFFKQGDNELVIYAADSLIHPLIHPNGKAAMIRPGDVAYNPGAVIFGMEFTSVTVVEPPLEERCETMYGFLSDDDSTCFIGHGDYGFSNWGWTTKLPEDGNTTFGFELYAGADHCSRIKDGVSRIVGNALVEIDGATTTVTFQLDEGWRYGTGGIQINTGSEPYPQKKNGDYTTAPGQYSHKNLICEPNENPLVCKVTVATGAWIILHGNACTGGGDEPPPPEPNTLKVEKRISGQRTGTVKVADLPYADGFHFDLYDAKDQTGVDLGKKIGTAESSVGGEITFVDAAGEPVELVIGNYYTVAEAVVGDYFSLYSYLRPTGDTVTLGAKAFRFTFQYALVDGKSPVATFINYRDPNPPVGGGCDTIFGFLQPVVPEPEETYGSMCFLNDPAVKNNRWGWTSQLPDGAGRYDFTLYAGAAKCGQTEQRIAGFAQVDVYADGKAIITYDLIGGWRFASGSVNGDEGGIHVYMGEGPYPLKNGKITLAPGQYSPKALKCAPTSTPATNCTVTVPAGSWIILHGGACRG